MRNLASDPLRNFKFLVQIVPPAITGMPSSIQRMGFMTADGFGIANEVIQYREGGDNTTTRKMPGQSDFGPITFGRGMLSSTVGPGSSPTNGSETYKWLTSVFSVIEGGGAGGPGQNFRTNVSVDVLEHPVTAGQSAAGLNNPPPVKARFLIYNAWPMALNWSGLDAGGNAIMIESLQLAHEGFTPVYGTTTPGQYLPAVASF